MIIDDVFFPHHQSHLAGLVHISPLFLGVHFLPGSHCRSTVPPIQLEWVFPPQNSSQCPIYLCANYDFCIACTVSFSYVKTGSAHLSYEALFLFSFISLIESRSEAGFGSLTNSAFLSIFNFHFSIHFTAINGIYVIIFVMYHISFIRWV